jgi:hypothetical protein
MSSFVTIRVSPSARAAIALASWARSVFAPTGGVRTLSGFRQRIRQEHRDRVALVKALAAPIGVEIAALFKLIELALRY